MAVFTPAPPVDAEAADAVRVGLGATPRGVSFGRLCEPAAWLAGAQGQVPARSPMNARLVVFAGHNSIAGAQYQGAGLSAFAPAATDEQVGELRAGAGPVSALARRHGVGVSLINVTDTCGPAGGIDTSDAMDAATVDAAFELGAKTANSAVDAGADLLIPAELGVGATTVAAAVMGVMTRTEPVQIVGPGSGTTDAMWKTKVRVVRDAMFRARNFASDPRELIQLIGSPNLAALTAFIAQAAQRRTPVLIDGPLVATAALLAERLSMDCRHWCYATGIGPEPAHRLALEELGLVPLLNLDIRAGGGMGALNALPLVISAVDLAAGEVAAVSRNLS